MSRKTHAAGQGVVASANLDTIFQREIFFPVDPITLDWIDHAELLETISSGMSIELDPEKFFDYLPELEAEIFYLVFVLKKNQKDIAKLLGLSQPTISYRYRRVLVKLCYLMTLLSVNLDEVIAKAFFLKDHERLILRDLFFFANQEMVGKKHQVRQSSVKWIFVKTKKRVTELELEEPEQWCNFLGLLILLERNLNVRVMNA